MNIAKILMMSGWIVLSTLAILAAETTGGKPGSTSAADQKAIASAMSAAPKKVSAAATIVVIGKDGKMRTLRKGNNGFTCMPDNPTTVRSNVHGQGCAEMGRSLDGTQTAKCR